MVSLNIVRDIFKKYKKVREKYIMKKFKRGQLILFSENNRKFIGCILYFKDQEFRILREDNCVLKISEDKIIEKLEIMDNLNYLSLFFNTVSDIMLHKALELEKIDREIASYSKVIEIGNYIDQYPVLEMENKLNYILKYCMNYMSKTSSISFYFFKSTLYEKENRAFVEIVDLTSGGSIYEINIEGIPQKTKITKKIF